MKKSVLAFSAIASSCLLLASCDFFSQQSASGIYTDAYDAATGRFALYEAADKRQDYGETYFEINGAKGVFDLKYYEKGSLKKAGKIQRLLAHEDRIGKWCINLHFNVLIEGVYEHFSAYTENFSPLNQFRIIEEYVGSNNYYLSELPFALGTYVRVGAEYKAEGKNTNKVDYMVPTEQHFTSALDGIYRLDDEHYFYFLCPRAWTSPDGGFLSSYFQYYSSSLEKPIEGFAKGFSSDGVKSIALMTRRDVVDWGKEMEGRIRFGYYTVENDSLVDHYGSVDFSEGVVRSFSFEHLSRHWTDAEMNRWVKEEDYELPDPILYDFVGGTYAKG